MHLKLRCYDCFTHAFTACGCVFEEIALVGSNQGNSFENATAYRKRKLKTTVATQLYAHTTKVICRFLDSESDILAYWSKPYLLRKTYMFSH